VQQRIFHPRMNVCASQSHGIPISRSRRALQFPDCGFYSPAIWAIPARSLSSLTLSSEHRTWCASRWTFQTHGRQ
jgi:hypothetical protein